MGVTNVSGTTLGVVVVLVLVLVLEVEVEEELEVVVVGTVGAVGTLPSLEIPN